MLELIRNDHVGETTEMIKRKTLVFLCLLLLFYIVGCNGTEDNAEQISGGQTETVLFTEERRTVSSEITRSPEDTPIVPKTEIESDETFFLPETEAFTEETSSLKNEELPLGYTAPEGWYSPRYETGSVDGGGYKLKQGIMGLKVYYVEKKLGMRPYTWGYYTERLEDEVAFYQGRQALDYTGNVDLETWLSMGFTEDEWYNLGTYVSPVRITKQSTRDEIIDVFISRAKEYLKTPFVVGASGKPGEGVDCSGLVLQCLYTIGIYPDGLDPVQHSTMEEYNSRLMYADPKFKDVPIGELLPGDLVFYRRPWSWSVCHVAIYLGDGECIEALYSDVEYLPLYKDDVDYTIIGCKRVIALSE